MTGDKSLSDGFGNADRGGGDGRGKGGGSGSGRGSRRAAEDTALFPGEVADPSSARLLVCCVDDTDDLTAQTSTGYVAETIAGHVATLGGRVLLGITRHQLLLSELVPYTSHNSSMCFAALVPPGSADAIESCAVDALLRLCAESADPGLCIAELPADGGLDELRTPIDRLIAFGRKAKVEVCTKDEAYSLAQDLPWARLSEHGGSGQGVIGALAGVGLRLSGDDGRFRGTWKLDRIYAHVLAGPQSPASEVEGLPETVLVGAFRTALSDRVAGLVRVLDTCGAVVPDTVPLFLAKGAKPLFLGGALSIIVEVRDGAAIPCSKAELDQIDDIESWKRGCSSFIQDNDAEECADDTAGVCRNCLYRRLTMRGFECVAGC